MRNDIKFLVLAAAVGGCGDSGRATATDSGTSAPTSVTLPSSPSDPSATGTMSEGLTDTVTASESGTGTDTDSITGLPTESNTAVTVTTPPTTTDSDSGVKTDLGGQPDFGVPGCGGGGMGGDEPDFSYIWVANSAQNTISKIDTQTLQELGRYLVRPDGLGNPSRTSVNLSGDVVTASRDGGFTKFYARIEDCVESNGVPGIQTAVDANYLPWDQEECRAWHTPMAYISQRPAAWTQGTLNQATCKYENQKAWTSGNNDTFESADNQLDVLRVNGDTGVVEATVNIVGVMADYYGIYGAAVDNKGNFWGSQLGIGKLVFIDYETLQYKMWDMPTSGYGMTVDSKGYVWTCSYDAARFDPMTETWLTAQVGGSGGCMEDGQGTLYMSGGGGTIVAVDTETLTVKQNYPVPQYVHGISIDFYGYVWGVSMGTEAYRVDPMNGQYQTFTGLVGAYTYSDMTGFALSNVGVPSG